jgi:hypothetical protein
MNVFLPTASTRKSVRLSWIFFLGAGIVILASACRQIGIVPSAPTPTWTPEPIVPTRTPELEALSTIALATEPAATATTTTPTEPAATAEPSPTSSPDSLDASQTLAEKPAINIEESEVWRFGVTGGIGNGQNALEAGLPFGALLNWLVAVDVSQNEFVFWQMVRTEEAGIRRTTWEEIELAIEANPGSYWLVGNEPDVRWQDNVTPQRYAEIYHDVYTFIKERDPEAKLVIGGVTQPTPLRRAYLDVVLDTYEERYGEKMPIDVWNVHAFTLREERDSWGVDIPPGMADDLAIEYEIDDHDDLEILRQNLIDFRAWMADRGYGDKPLIISEYGILMPEDYGFPLQRVADYLTGSFDLFQTLSGENGYQLDDGRLVQQWFWYSIYDNELYSTGNLFVPSVGELTPLGEVWAEYVNGSSIDSELAP